jgi:Mrp family chromosome partitioning ATPase
VRLVQELKTRYPTRMVIFDLPPVLSADDALAFAPYVDAALLVIDEGRTKRDEVTRAVGYLRTTELLGTVLNRSHEAEGLHYY